MRNPLTIFDIRATPDVVNNSSVPVIGSLAGVVELDDGLIHRFGSNAMHGSACFGVVILDFTRLCRYKPLMPHDIPSSRRDTILARLSAGQPVRSGALAEEFGLSEDAIRRDLRSLAAEGLCRRVYGGALPVVEGATPMTERVGEDVQRKHALADAALQFLEPSSFVFLDNGSSNLALVQKLPPYLNLTIATSSITIAAALQERDDIDLLMVGGVIDRMVGGAVDGTAIEAILRLNIDLCVLGACALSVEGGVSAYDPADATFKRALTARSRSTIALATSDKLGRRAPHRVCAVDALTHIVVEHDADADSVHDLTEAGAPLTRADRQALSRQC